MSIQIIPSLLTQTQEEFLGQYHAVKNSVSCVQIDIADGDFVPNKTWADPTVIAQHATTDIELHLMVRHPREEMERWKNVKQVKRVLVHYETIMDDIDDVFNDIDGKYCWQKSLVFNPGTSTEILTTYGYRLNGIMFMGVTPGFQGQTLIPSVLEEIKRVKKQFSFLSFELDGGVNEDTLPDIIASGIEIICPGSAIFHNDRTPKENVYRMQKLIDQLTKPS